MVERAGKAYETYFIDCRFALSVFKMCALYLNKGMKMNKRIGLLFLMGMGVLPGCWHNASNSTNDNASWSDVGAVNAGSNVDNSSNVFGSVVLSHKNVENLNVFGSATLDTVVVRRNASINGEVSGKNLTIEGSLSVNGSLSGKDIAIKGDLSMHGACEIISMQVGGVAKIKGYLEAAESTFAAIIISTQKMVLRNSKADSIVVRKPGIFENKQQVLILDNTIIAGDVVFEKNGGTVLLLHNAKVNGKVVGAVIE